MLGDTADIPRAARYFPRLRSDVHGWSVISGRTQKAVVGSLDQDTGWTAWNETEGLKAWGWHVLK